MRPQGWGLVITAVAAGWFAACPVQASDGNLRRLGASAGIVAAFAGLALRARRGAAGPSESSPPLVALPPRFCFDRRRTPRWESDARVQLVLHGHTCSATLVNVSASGALLRLEEESPAPRRRAALSQDETVRRTSDPAAAGPGPAAVVGELVCIDDRVTGTVARVGRQGLYLEFAVQLDGVRSAPAQAALSPSKPSQ